MSPMPTDHQELVSSARGSLLDASGENMKKAKPKQNRRKHSDEDTLRPEYDFSNAVRGVTAARYAAGSNVVLLDPDVAKVFPNAIAVNEALRTLVRVRRPTSRTRRPPKRITTR